MNKVGHSMGGQALMEMALVLPVLIFTIAATVQVGIIMHTRILMEMAVRQGLRLQAAHVSGAAEQVKAFLEKHSLVEQVKYQVISRRILTHDEVVVSCELPTLHMFQKVLGDSVSLQAELRADGYGAPFFSTIAWLWDFFR